MSAGTFNKVYFNAFDRGRKCTPYADNQMTILAGLGALFRKCRLGVPAHNSSSFLYALRTEKKLLSNM